MRPNYAAITKFSEEKHDLPLSDSTNANRPGMTPSEASVGAALRHIIKMQLVVFICVVLKPHSPPAAGVRCLCCVMKRKVVVTER